MRYIWLHLRLSKYLYNHHYRLDNIKPILARLKMSLINLIDIRIEPSQVPDVVQSVGFIVFFGVVLSVKLTVEHSVVPSVVPSVVTSVVTSVVRGVIII